MHLKYLPGLLLVLLFISCSSRENPNTTISEISFLDIKSHITYLAGDDLKGREAGSLEEAKAANYIADHFRDYKLEPAGDGQTYFQHFTINTANLNNPHAESSEADSAAEKRLSKNVVALLSGTGESEEFIIIGAHYDHLGVGEFGSLYSGEKARIHNGADDNASGTAGLLELAEYFSANRPQTDILFIAFSGEEMGLLGSQYFVENPTKDLDQTRAMINMDMIGRMKNNKLMIFGTGTWGNWESLIIESNSDSLDLDLVPDGTGASDHTSFYFKNIPVLHYFTDTHADYHRPSDDFEYINAEGQELILKHLSRLIHSLDSLPKESLAFIEAPGKQRQSMTMDGPTLGVLPDYGYDGKGMKITGVSKGRAAQQAGLKGGDIIIYIAGNPLEDIYAYMSALNTLEKGQKTTITILRDGKEMTLDLQL
ncbi:MAG: M28 family peptidase [Balneolaceae bacterium]